MQKHKIVLSEKKKKLKFLRNMLFVHTQNFSMCNRVVDVTVMCVIVAEIHVSLRVFMLQDYQLNQAYFLPKPILKKVSSSINGVI